MRLYLIRHAEAHARSGTGRDDDRELTPLGERQAGFLAGALADEGITLAPGLGSLLTSPAARARATAEAIGQALGVAPAIAPALECGRSAAGVLDLIEASGDDVLLLVGHNPTISDLACTLARHARDVCLRTGECLALEYDLRPGRGLVLAAWRWEEEEADRTG